MKELRLGLIGAGGMGLSLAEAVNRCCNAQITAVADPVEECARTAAERLGGEVYSSHTELLSRANVDAVLIATPNFAHREIAEAAATAKKHIFCEKPMALTVEDCDAMIDAAKGAGVKLMVGQVLRLTPTFARGLEIALSGELGKPLAIASERSFFWSLTGWRRQRSLMGGVLFEVNVHELDYMRAVFGDAEEVFAAIPEAKVPGTDMPGIHYVVVRFRSGGVGMLNSNVLTPQGQYSITITCEKGSIRCCGWNSIEYQPLGGPVRRVTAEDLQAMPSGEDKEILSFVEWVLHDKPPVVTAQDGRAAVELAEAALRSGAVGQPVRLPLGVANATRSYNISREGI